MPIRGLTDNAVKTSIEALNGRLADLIALRLAVKQAHWNVKGPNFIAIHELFDAVAGRLATHEDTVAERVQILGGTALGTVEVVSSAARVKPYPTDLVEDKAHVREIADRLADLGSVTREAIEACAEAGDEGTADIFVALSRQLDEDLWFIESHVAA